MTAFIRHFFLILLAAAGLLTPAQAHPIFQNSLWVEYSETEITANVVVTVKEIATAAGIPFSLSGEFDKDQVEEAAPKHIDYLLGHLKVMADSAEVKGELVQIIPPVTWEVTDTDKNLTQPEQAERPDRLHYNFHLKYPVTKPPGRITLSQTTMTEFSYSPGVPFNFSYISRVTRKGEKAKDFGLLAVGGTFDVPTDFAVSGEAGPEARTWKTRFGEYTKAGIHHVLTGYDHLLFAAALVLALRSFWEVFKIVGIFTLAHSITVTLSAYRLVHIPDFVVEPLIAGSIVFVALENVFYPQGSRGWRRMAWTFFFGLVHGLGLAGALVDNLQGLSMAWIALAVVAFCLGVEIGHLCIVGPLSVALGIGRAKGGEWFSQRVMKYGSVIVAIGGFYFFLNALGWLPEWLSPDTLFGMS